MPLADAPRRRAPGVPWLRPVRPGLTRLVAAPLLLSGAALLALTLVVLPAAAGSWVGWVLTATLAVHAAAVWVVPARTVAGDLVVASAVLTATAAVAVSTVLLAGTLHAWAILLGLPVIYASSMFRRAVAIAATTLACAASVAVLLITSADASAPEFWVDVALVCGCLVILAVFVVHGMEHIAALLAELERTAAVDGLTGLVNRRVLDAALAASLSTAVAEAGTALVLVDLDHFKAVNDRHGHPVGDAVLRHVGSVLAAAVRSTDAVVSRFGGDELAVLLPGCPVDVARTRAGDLVAAVRGTPLVLEDGTTVPLSVSVGVAHAPEHAVDVRTLYSAADAALYAAKRAGRDGFAVAAG
ncbi:diguanylate cyclase (GGDEF) domain-containing protein [Klenkia marina]|uniref:Diguanylate cyclase (GGDEF) domain-containing protein n=1 Tax=Klenkia marina TaxID=1960309 RepID=A0A1G4XHE2_9ACTN|nr:GGDEF domain-containing protein [Klenkia marina]SCX40454.1 diguanylate cyclase (GGDEF) domain-containing protein [Klenkia marina]